MTRACPRPMKLIASAVALAIAWPSVAHAEPPELQPGEFAPVEIHPVELPEPPPEPEPIEIEPDSNLDTDTDTELADREDQPLEDDYDPLRDSPQARDARRWMGAGIAAFVTGGTLVAGAAAMGLTKPCDDKAGNNCFRDARDRATLTLSVPGVLLLVGGIAMMIVGGERKRQLRRDVAVRNVLDGRF